jgi:hypothetical protein
LRVTPAAAFWRVRLEVKEETFDLLTAACRGAGLAEMPEELNEEVAAIDDGAIGPAGDLALSNPVRLSRFEIGEGESIPKNAFGYCGGLLPGEGFLPWRRLDRLLRWLGRDGIRHGERSGPGFGRTRR